MCFEISTINYKLQLIFNQMKMKKLLSASAIAALALLGFNANAGNVDANTARMTAKNFVNQRVGAHKAFQSTASVSDIKLAHTEASSVEGNAYYVFNIQGGGWVIVAGDDHAKQVLAYGDKGNIDMKDLPGGMESQLNQYKKQIEHMQSFKGEVAPIKAYKRSTVVEPLLKTNWGQGEPMNRLCPMNGTKRTSVGCGPLSMAQIMYYWKYPEGSEAMSSYYAYPGVGTVPALEATTFNYDLMIDHYHIYNPETNGVSLGTYTEEQANEVAKLSRYCGHASKARYGNSGTTGTGTYSYDVLAALKLFGFNSEAKLIGIDPSYYCDNYVVGGGGKYTDEEWAALIYTELEAGRPIPYCNVDPFDGHAWVLDGVDADGKFHMNWGFYGKFNGWFELNALIIVPYDDEEVWNFSGGSNEMIIDMYPYEGYVIPGAFTRGDVNNDGEIKISDVTALINYLLSGDATSINLQAADCNQDGEIKIADVTALINYLLSGAW